MAEYYYCTACGCPVNEHDDNGVCHALDLPEIGHVNDFALAYAHGLRSAMRYSRRSWNKTTKLEALNET